MSSNRELAELSLIPLGLVLISLDFSPVTPSSPYTHTHTLLFQLLFPFGHSAWLPCGELRFPTRGMAVKAPNPNHWTTRKLPQLLFFLSRMEGIFSTLQGKSIAQRQPFSFFSFTTNFYYANMYCE